MTMIDIDVIDIMVEGDILARLVTHWGLNRWAARVKSWFAAIQELDRLVRLKDVCKEAT